MSGRKRLRDQVKDSVDEAVRLIDQGADKAGELIDRGARRIEEGARQADRPATPASPGPKARVEDVVDDGAASIGRAGRKVLNATDRGIKRVGGAVDRNPDIKHVIDRGVAVVDRVVEKGVEVTRKGVKRTEDIIDEHKRKRAD